MASFCMEFGKRQRFFDHRVKLRRRQSDPPATNGDSLLPEQAQAGRLTLVLDLDETLAYIKCASGCLINCTCGDEGDEFYLAKRPGVDEFLRRMAQLYEVVLWTAAHQMYADAALEVLDPTNEIFSSRLYRQHLDAEDKKDLSRLGRDLSRVIAVDDCLARFPDGVQSNVIRVDRYVADGSPDHQLETKLADLLVEMASCREDVRLRLKQAEQEGATGRQTSGSAPWCPSWRKSKQQQQQLDVIKVQVEDSVYTPAASEANMGEPSLLFGVKCESSRPKHLEI